MKNENNNCSLTDISFKICVTLLFVILYLFMYVNALFAIFLPIIVMVMLMINVVDKSLDFDHNET